MPHTRPHRLPLMGSLLVAVLLTVLAGCATPPPASDPGALADYNDTNDPLEPTNRFFYKVNNGLDTYFLRPLALGYRRAVPGVVRQGIHNALANLGTPVQLSNDMLEGKPRRAGDTWMRFLINTTVGVVGVMDVAKDWGYPSHDADFGLTFGVWGISQGPFLFLPFLGPSDPRDATGFGVGIAADPFTWLGSGTIVEALDWTKFAVSAIDARERVLDDTDSIKKTALDPYATFRSLYRQHRDSQLQAIKDDQRATVPVWFPQH
jgi:phospholipid-binding lipoprotein MlaA